MNDNKKWQGFSALYLYLSLGVIAIFYWFIESVLHNYRIVIVEYFPELFSSPTSYFMQHLIGANLYELISRLIVLCFFAIFASHTWYALNERRKAEEYTKSSEKKYQTIIESIEDGYYEVDLNGNFTFFNDSLCKIYGLSKKELMKLNSGKFMGKENINNDIDYPDNAYDFTLQTGRAAKVIDLEIQKKDGKKANVETSVSPMMDLKGNVMGYRGITRDVTDAKRANELIHAKIAAEAASTAKSTFLANMSHEIRTPLNGIIGMTELVMETNINDNQRNNLQIILSESDNLLTLINDILDFSKIEAGKVELETIPFDLEALIDDVANKFIIRAEQKGLELNSFLSPDVPTQLNGDPGKLRQILVNLLGNAIKFTHKGEIFIKVELENDSDEMVKIRFIVKDTGIGISEDKQNTIFEDFTQADSSTTRKYGGTGLGTSISKRLTELMGGEIGIDRKNGDGSIFWFTAVFRRQTKYITIPVKKDVTLNSLKVLVVDDNENARHILTEYLKSWAACPIEAQNGKQALTTLQETVSSQEPVQLILSDIRMPEMDGFELTREINANKAFKGMPIILFTSAGNIGDISKCRELEVETYITKPIKKDDLRKAIKSTLGLKRDKKQQNTPEKVTTHTLAEDPQKEFNILLVEDYPTNQQVALRHLRGAGYNVDLAENGQEAVDAFQRARYDLILMDIQMHVMDGYEATSKIRQLEGDIKRKNGDDGSTGLKRVPIAAMTAHAIKGFRENCIKAGMDDYITKPLRRVELLNFVEKYRKSGLGLNADDSHEESKDTNKKKEDPMNFDEAIEEFDNDRAFLMEVISGFLKNVETQIKTLHQAISEGNSEVVLKEAHSIAGGASNLTAHKLNKIAVELENLGRSSTLQNGHEVLEKFSKEYNRLKEYTSHK